ncbi:GMC family oxidoreductase [Allopusillimonas ginsengisoli]|uniref:GMC family oxidoreductase n=1 Tax=Allopusillimonas ginsengisoli TaxID=453575 RepID=UPI001021A771|nr:choline dehydrogenase [Allopusillimonas ginsengisoli]TEA78881.1 choline dehydrogenase [Allopusillimonas ginsengisoli]
MAKRFDYIVIGAGSAGCVLASRLSEDPSVQVLLLEAGPPDTSIWLHLPIGYGKTMWSKKYNWCLYTDPDPNMNGRRIYWPRGKTLGGSSAINGLIYIRGQRQDYDHWAALGNEGWRYEDVLPYFIKSESNERGASQYHGDKGPLKVSDIAHKDELIEAFLDGAEEVGIRRTPDFNGLDQEGVGYYQLTTFKGLRCSTATGYLRPARGRSNLTVCSNARATGLILDGCRAVGVNYLQRGRKQSAYIKQDGEVLVSAGAIFSPQLLQLSGIGSASLLQAHGIPVVVDLPGVGENLQDHLQIRLGFECSKPITTNDALNSMRGKVCMGLEWLTRRQGPLAVGINQGGCFMRALPDESDRPDIQFHVATLSADMAGGKVHPYSGFTLSVCQLRPESRGHVRIKSTNPLALPEIQSNYLATDLDRRTTVAAIRAARQIARSQAMRPYIKREVKPGPEADTDEDLLAFSRDTGATIFHPSGTCRMGPEGDAMAVLDAQMRVRGVQGLRVIDASSMPTLVSGNTNAPVIMMAEKVADLIREERRQLLTQAEHSR